MLGFRDNDHDWWLTRRVQIQISKHGGLKLGRGEVHGFKGLCTQEVLWVHAMLKDLGHEQGERRGSEKIIKVLLDFQAKQDIMPKPSRSTSVTTSSERM